MLSPAPARDVAKVCLAYVAAGAAGYGAVALAPPMHPVAQTALADVVGTVVIFGSSRLTDNSSMYDAYWSVLPMALAGWHVALAPAGADGARKWLVLALVAVWGLRLTYNWLRGWPGLHHEDWRYRDFRVQWGRWYWPGSFAGIHFFPTVLTWLGCLSLWPAMQSATPLGPLDAVAAVVTLGATAIEAVADEQLRAFRASKAGGICDVGLWSRSRHPNYFGEIGFWVGLWLFVVAAAPADAGWTSVGPLSMWLLFRFASIPLADKRSLARRPGYAEHIARVPALVPSLFPRAKG